MQKGSTVSAYTVALFVHVIGVGGMFAGFGSWFLGLIALRRAERVEQVRTITMVLALAHSVGAGSVVLVIIPGLYMALTMWGLQTSWIAVSIVGVLVAAPIGPTLIEPRVEALGAIARETPDGLSHQSLRHAPTILCLALPCIPSRCSSWASSSS